MVTVTTLATPASTEIVKPNVDTLYMTQYYDVSQQDVELTIGEVESDRYYSVSFYTPYGDNFLNFGSLNPSPSGKYLVSLATSPENNATIESYPGGEHQGIIYSPNTFGILLIRILVKNSTTDLPVAQEIQRGFSSIAVSRNTTSTGPPLSLSFFTDNSTSAAEHLMTLTSRMYETFSRVDDATFLPTETVAQLALAGIELGSYSKPSDSDLSAAAVTANASIASYMHSDAFILALNNGWVLPRSDKVGIYGADYTARAAVARWAYLALVDEISLYPIYNPGFNLEANESYKLIFAGRPPVEDIGFWSVNMYNQAGYLVENELGRYSLGDRSNMTFSDGSQVYGEEVGADGPFEILVQASEPPANWTNNWLPSPSTPVRFYGPQESLRNGSYSYPMVIKGSVV
ncbi:hypothetical protein GQ53DRAFT_887596 [Thozetella sp. PMI_491]|nr:hypothetical protein GQ53DRAFT_887596 [Thozetella sp. PMI_491]